MAASNHRQGLIDFGNAIQEAIEDSVAEFATLSFRYIITEATGLNSPFGSPVYSGTYITNHNISLNSPDVSAKPRIKRRGVYKAPTLSVSDSVLAQYKLGDTIFITNASKNESGEYYAEFIEAGIYSQKTPEGVYGVATRLAELSYKVKYGR